MQLREAGIQNILYRPGKYVQGYWRETFTIQSLDDKCKFMYILRAGVDIAELVAKFSYDSLP